MDAATLKQAMSPTGVSDGVLFDYLPHFKEAMRAADINTVRRAAAFCSQLGHESGGLRYMAEIETSNPTWTADRTRYRGRGPIQLTWMGNYRKFGQWCVSKGYITDSELFVKQPELVEQPRWGFLAASWYWVNAGPKPGQINGFADKGDILAVSRCVNGWVEGKQPNGMADRQSRWDRCLVIGDKLISEVSVPDNRPDFNEINEIGLDNGRHASKRSRPPVNWFLHTQEGDGNATDLSAYLRSTSGAKAVSYHYTIHEDQNDHGVTVVDVVDTDLYSWSVLDANVFSINLCFAGSRASWSRAEWLKRSKAIDVAAYLAVQDCRKYKFSTEVIKPPYGTARSGISDHKYVTECLDIGNHTDVGPNFPWDVFEAAVKKYSGEVVEPPVVVPPVPPFPPPVTNKKRFPEDWTTRELVIEMLVQMRGPNLEGWPQLGKNDKGEKLTVVDALAKILAKG